MKSIQFKSDDVSGVLERVAAVVNPKNVMVALSNVRIKTFTDANGVKYLELLASDGEIWLRMFAKCDDAAPDIAMLLDAREFAQSLKSLSGKYISMNIDEERNVVTCQYDNGQFKMSASYSSDEYPLPPSFTQEITDATSVTIPSQNLASSIRNVIFASKTNDIIRPYLNGVHFIFRNDHMIAVAMDGIRMAEYKDFSVKNESNECCLTFPKKVCTTLTDVLQGVDSNVLLTFNDSSIVFKNDSFELYARTVEGNYPKFETFLPKEFNTEYVAKKKDILTAISRVLPFSNANGGCVSLSFKKSTIKVSAECFERNKSASEDILARASLSNEEVVMGFNGAYLSRIVQSVEDECVKISILQKTRPVLITAESDASDVKYRAMLMPMNI